MALCPSQSVDLFQRLERRRTANHRRYQGTVIDPSGAAVPSANIELRNNATTVGYTQSTGSEGQFIVNLLPPGSYHLQVSAPGFQTASLNDVIVEVNKSTPLLVELKVGATSESVEVQAGRTAIDTASAAFGVGIGSHVLSNLPTTTATRNPLAYAEMASPGLRLTDRGSQVVANQGSTINSNGNRKDANIYYLDGSDNTGPYRSTVLQMPNPEAIAELQVTTANSSADVGKNSGALVNVITKSGTNQFHGSGFYFFGVTDFNANSWTANQSGAKRPDAKLKQGGGTLGGPIRRDRTFFFASTQIYRDAVQRLQNTAMFPSQELLGGDFSAFSRPLYDPATRQPIPNNRIPSNLLDPVSAKLAQLMPVAPAFQARYVNDVQNTTNNQEVLGKIDHNIRSSHRLQGSFFHSWGSVVYPMTNSGTNNVPAWGPTADELRQNTLSIQHVWTARPNLLLESRFSFSDFQIDRQSRVLGRNLADFGAIWPNATESGRKYLPYINVSNAFSTAQGTLGLQRQHNEDGRSTLTWVRGVHNLKFGGEIQRRALPANKDQDSTMLAFTGQFSSTGPSGVAGGTGTYGYSVADFLMGRLATFSTAAPDIKTLYSWSYFLYAQDEWRVSRKLTITPGMRYETYMQVREPNGKLTNFLFGNKSPNFTTAPAGLAFQGDPGVPDGFHPVHRVWAPRLGIAYDPRADGKMVIRAGFGMYYTAVGMQWAGLTGAPWQPSANGGVARLIDPWGTSQSPAYSRPPTPFVIDPQHFVYPGVFGVAGYDPALKRPYTIQWNIAMERAINRNVKFQAAYVANRGGNLFQYVQGNLPAWTAAASLNNIQARRPYQNYSDIQIIQSRARSWYDAVQFTGDLRSGSALTMRFTYAYGRTAAVYDEGWDSVPVFTANPLNIDGDKAEIAPRHMFRYFAIYSLPSLRNHPLAVRAPLGGWKLSGSLYLTSGTPLNVILGQDWNFDGIPNDRPDFASQVRYTSGSADAKAASFFSKESFATPAIRNTFGNVPRNTLWGPGQYWQPHVALLKDFHFSESTLVQFRAESYNFLNHNTLDPPNAAMNNSNFSRILSRSGNRTMQLGLRFAF